MTQISPYIHRKVVVLYEDDTADSAAKAMEAHGIGCVMVADHQGHLVGIVTDRDLACRVLAHQGGGGSLLRQAMTRDPVKVSEDAQLDAAIQAMEAHGIRRVPVVRKVSGDQERCVGLISLDDLIASRDIGDYRLMRVVRAQGMRRIRDSSEYQRTLRVTGPDVPRKTDGSLANLRQDVALAADLPEDQAEGILSVIATSIAGRLHHTGAMYFAAILPDELQQELMEVPPGPDPSISAAGMISQIARDFGFPEGKAEFYVHQICRALENWVGFERFDHVKFQLPKDIRALFGREELRMPREAA